MSKSIDRQGSAFARFVRPETKPATTNTAIAEPIGGVPVSEKVVSPTAKQGARLVNSVRDREAADRITTTSAEPNSGTVRRGVTQPTAKGTPATGFEGSPNVDLAQTAKTLRDHFDSVAGAAGGSGDIITVDDLEKVANDPAADATLKATARNVLADPQVLSALDIAGGNKADNKISRSDLDRVVENDGNTALTLQQVVDVFRDGDNFKTLDSANNGKEDGLVGRSDLEKVAGDEKANAELRAAAKAVLADQNMFNQLDASANGKSDSLIGKSDLDNINYSPTPEAGQQFTDADDQALQQALGRSYFDGALFGGVHQTDRGNCAATAVIKAALDTYGNDVFQSANRGADGSYSVKLKDGTDVKVTREELEAAATASHYTGSDPQAIAMGNLAYAVMAKRAEALGHEGAGTYSQALLAIANGEFTDDVPRYLGLQGQVKEIDIKDVKGKDGVVVWGNGHALYADTRNDKTYIDAWGNREVYDGTNQVGDTNNELTHAFVFV